MRGRRIAYSEAEMRWLEANRMMVISDYHRAFCTKFDRQDVTSAQLHGLRKRKGWKVGRAPGRYVGRHSRYSEAEIAWLHDHCTMEINEWCAAFREEFDRDDATPGKLHSLRQRMGWKTGRTGRFETGMVPANKGKPCPPGTGGRHPNARATQFRKGHGRTGCAVKLYKPIGTERITRDGYRERKIHDGMPLQSRWRAVHLIEWERENGPIPDGHALKCLDGDKANTAPSNWEAVPRSMLPRLAGGSHKQYVPYDSAPDELKPAILAVAKIEQAGRARRKGKREVALREPRP